MFEFCFKTKTCLLYKKLQKFWKKVHVFLKTFFQTKFISYKVKEMLLQNNSNKKLKNLLNFKVKEKSWEWKENIQTNKFVTKD